MSVGEAIQSVYHLGVIGRTDLPFLHVREEIVHAVLQVALVACGDRGGLGVIPRGMVRRKGVVGWSRDVAREVNVTV